MKLNQFSASVYIDNRALLEYKKVESHTPYEKKISCWVASELGKKFDVRGRLSRPEYPGLKASTTVDGVECPAWVVLPPWKGTVKFDCVTDSDTMKSHKLIFEEINFTDDDSALGNNTDDIGKIVMIFQKGKFTASKNKCRVQNTRAHSYDLAKVHEASKKGRDHQVGFSEAESLDQEIQTLYTHDLDHTSKVIIFEFKFTSLYHLQAMDIVPRPTRMSNRLSLRPRNVQPLLTNARTKQQQKVKLERLRSEEVAINIAAGNSSCRCKKPSPVKSEIIDLTLD